MYHFYGESILNKCKPSCRKLRKCHRREAALHFRVSYTRAGAIIYVDIVHTKNPLFMENKGFMVFIVYYFLRRSTTACV